MDIQRKLELLEIQVRSISEHHDVDAAVRKAALTRAKAICDAAADQIDAEIAAAIESTVG